MLNVPTDCLRKLGSFGSTNKTKGVSFLPSTSAKTWPSYTLTYLVTTHMQDMDTDATQ